MNKKIKLEQNKIYQLLDIKQNTNQVNIQNSSKPYDLFER